MDDAGDLAAVYVDLHANPELGFHQTRTAALIAAQLSASGFDVTAGVGGTGVVGLLRNGEGPLVLLRADMDALPVERRLSCHTQVCLAPSQTADRMSRGVAG